MLKSFPIGDEYDFHYTDIAWSYDGLYIATVCDDGTLRLYAVMDE